MQSSIIKTFFANKINTKPEDIIHAICLIVVDLSRPWLLKQSLEKWIKFVQEVFAQLISKLPDDKQQEVKQNGKNNFY